MRREAKYDTLISPGGEASQNVKVEIPVGWTRGEIVLRFDVAVPLGGRIVQERLRVQVGT